MSVEQLSIQIDRPQSELFGRRADGLARRRRRQCSSSLWRCAKGIGEDACRVLVSDVVGVVGVAHRGAALGEMERWARESEWARKRGGGEWSEGCVREQEVCGEGERELWVVVVRGSVCDRRGQTEPHKRSAVLASFLASTEEHTAPPKWTEAHAPAPHRIRIRMHVHTNRTEVHTTRTCAIPRAGTGQVQVRRLHTSRCTTSRMHV